MIATIVKKEILDNLISLRFILLMLLSLILIPLSLYVNSRNYDAKVSDYTQSIQLHHEEWVKKGLMELFQQQYAVKGYRAPKPLSVFVNGLDNSSASRFEAQATGLVFAKADAINESILSLTGKLDFMFIIQIVFSLLAVLFTFDSISGEKENGTLQLSLSNNVPRSRYVLSKYLGSMVMLITPLVVSFLLGLIILLTLNYPVFDNAIFIRLMLMLATAIVLISVFVSIGVFVSSRTKSSKTSIIVLLCMWVVLTVIIPELSVIITKVYKPIQSREVVQLEKTMLRRNLEIEKGKKLFEIRNKQDQERKSTVRGSEEDNRIYDQHRKDISDIRSEYEILINNTINKIEQGYQNSKDQQDLFAYRLASISPITPFINIMTNLASTGNEAQNTFEHSAKTYWDILNQEMFKKIQRDINPDGSITLGLGGKIDHLSIPQFQEASPSIIQTFRTITIDGLLIIFYMILSFVMAYVSFLQYDIR